jgi:hypothetical protein
MHRLIKRTITIVTKTIQKFSWYEDASKPSISSKALMSSNRFADGREQTVQFEEEPADHELDRTNKDKTN